MALPLVIGTKTVTTAGTPVQVTTTHRKCSLIKFQSYKTNSGLIYIMNAASEILHTLTTAGEFYEFPATRRMGILWIDDWYVDSAVNGEKVDVVYYP